jgi:hypothetical protein
MEGSGVLLRLTLVSKYPADPDDLIIRVSDIRLMIRLVDDDGRPVPKVKVEMHNGKTVTVWDHDRGLFDAWEQAERGY